MNSTRGELINARIRAGAAWVQAQEFLAKIPLKDVEKRNAARAVVDARLLEYEAAQRAERDWRSG